MDVREVRDGAEWDRALLTLPHPHVLQSYTWGQVKRITGWTPRRLLLVEQETVCAAALVLRREVPGLGAPILYVPKGPLLAAEEDPALLERVLGLLEEVAHRERAVFVKVDPDLSADNRAALGTLARRGWRQGEPVQFRNTVRVDLCPDEEAILSRMKPKARYNIRLAARHGVGVRTGGMEDLPAFHSLYEETGRRDRFLTRPYPYYREVWQAFLEAGLARLLMAEHEGDLLAGLLALRFGPCAWYMYGASAELKREHMPNYLLQWEAIRWARAAGCTAYDLWGAPERLDESDPLWGVYRFKASFGGQFVAHIGAYDYVGRPALYRLVTWALPRVLALWRRLRGQPTLGQAGPA